MKSYHRTAGFLSLLALALVIAAQPSFATAKTLSYTVLRNGSPIGTHSYTLDTRDGETTVNVSTDIKVKVFFATVYEFVHTSIEKWKGGKLVYIQSTTNDDGIQKELEAQSTGAELKVSSVVKGQDRLVKAPGAVIPASLWSDTTVSQSSLLNTLDGTLMRVKVETIGDEVITAHGDKKTATHFKITGDLTRELWFDGDGNLVRVRFPAEDNSEIVYALN